MHNITLNLDKYLVSLMIPVGLDIDSCTVLSSQAELNNMNESEISLYLNNLGCIVVSIINI